ncbi:PQQ-binding-like beta-propeller repeat protein [Nocardia brasiliensis]|uniref:PQQ-binding-like beta-propeller repeat protein n=1 Tax=Nocardia brasiliensis TaxID=37326 RepID=A0A6G9XS75_NOCBR|nr:PQQ-binding-like beta-propeller repeat protein [Nocardia brasiliensis]QIS03710.1 PQQ-binding-like beta-propeller repeat protein [Nocardia brasiliensis]
MLVFDGQGVFGLGVGLAGFDLDTGAETWTTELTGCSRMSVLRGGLVQLVHSDCAGYRDTDLLDRTGRAIAGTDHAGVQSLSIDRPADDTVPVLLADGARDRRTGELVWSTPDLVTAGGGKDGTAVAVVGDTALLRDHIVHTMTGLDMRTGQRKWQVLTERGGTAAGWDGHVVVFADSQGLWAIDPGTGATAWEIPFAAVDTKAESFSGEGQLTAPSKGHYFYASAHTLLALRPL